MCTNFTYDKVYCHFQGSGNLDAIQIIKKLGGNLIDSYLDEGNRSLFVRLNIVDYKTNLFLNMYLLLMCK